MVLEKLFHVRTASDVRIVYTVFLFLAMIIGKVYNFYELMPWWDKFLHVLTGALLAVLGARIGLAMPAGQKPKMGYVFLFAISFSLACGAVWEIFEFTGDELLGLDSQLRATGVMDTMGDIIADTAGALSAAGIWCGLHRKK